MDLPPDLLARVDALVSERLAQAEAERRRRRRRWLVPVGLVSLVMLLGVGVAGWYGVTTGMDWIAARDAELSEARLAYQRELARNRAWQETRAAAVQATGYESQRTQAEHEAAVLQQTLGLVAEQGRLRAKWEAMNFEDPRDLEVLTQDLGRILDQGLGTLGQVLLRGTDPAHLSREERIRQEAAGELVAPPDPAGPAGAPSGVR